MTSEAPRPSIISKHTQVRQQKHTAAYPVGLHTSPRILDSLIAGIGYAGLAFYMLRNWHKHTPWELVGISLGSITIGYGLFDFGKRTGMLAGASFALQAKGEGTAVKEGTEEDDEDAWKGEFRGKDYEDLKTAEKIAWLKKEEEKIKALQQEEQLRCGQAYIGKEEAYTEYERFGGYGGASWQRYADADADCQAMYNEHQKQQQRLKQIRKETDELEGQI